MTGDDRPIGDKRAAVAEQTRGAGRDEPSAQSPEATGTLPGVPTLTDKLKTMSAAPPPLPHTPRTASPQSGSQAPGAVLPSGLPAPPSLDNAAGRPQDKGKRIPLSDAPPPMPHPGRTPPPSPRQSEAIGAVTSAQNSPAARPTGGAEAVRPGARGATPQVGVVTWGGAVRASELQLRAEPEFAPSVAATQVPDVKGELDAGGAQSLGDTRETAGAAAASATALDTQPQPPPEPSADVGISVPKDDPPGRAARSRPVRTDRPDADEHGAGEGDASRRRARRRPAAVPRGRIAANDDAPSIGGLIYALNQKPSDKPFYYAAIASVVWFALSASMSYIAIAPDMVQASGFIDLVRKSSVMTALATIGGPILLFWFMAFLAWRSEELHLRSTAMTEVAVRLAEPDRLAEQQVASLGQAVRRQVDYMNESVAHALSRANELESLIQSEVTALERSYEENERKIRGLLNELASERNALSGTGEHFKGTLETLARDVPQLIESLSTQQAKLASIVAGAGRNLTALESSLGAETTRLEVVVGETTQRLDATLSGRSGEIQALLESYATSIGSDVQQSSEALRAMLVEQSVKLGARLSDHKTFTEETLVGFTEAFGTVLEGRSQQIAQLISDEANRIETALDSRTSALSTTLETRTQAITSVLDDRASALDKLIGSREAQFGQALEGYVERTTGELDSKMQSIDAVIARRTETLQSVFEEYALALDTTLANRANALDTQLVERTRALDEAFNERLRLFDEAIMRSTQAIDSAVGENARALTSAMEQHAVELSDSIHRQAQKLDESLIEGISAVRRSSENISRQSIRAIEGLASQAEMLKSVSENLLGQINTVTNRFEVQGQTILRSANALESANFKIDKTLGQRAEELNQTLDRLSGRADELGRMVSGYSTQIEGTVNEAEQRTRLLTQELSREAEARSRSTLEEVARLKSETLREKDRALDELRSEFDAVTREVTHRLGVLSQQFSQTSGEVRARARRAADDIQADQERLRHHMDVLPVATRESAEAMRRALQDQLRALDQLTAYASQAGASRDVAPPVRPANQQAGPLVPYSDPQAQSRRPSAPVRTDGAHSGTPPSRQDTTNALSSLTSTLARELNQRRATQTQPPPGQGYEPSQPVPDQFPASPPPAAPHPVAAVRPTPQQQPDGRWSVGDLLARASADDDAPSPASRAGGAMLDVAAISKAMEPNLASAIWARFRSGQRGFMVRSIYTSTARDLFDSTKARYERDPQFRAAADNFMAEFEETLAELDRRDEKRQLSAREVTTEAGRVYLFLAHASGRLA
ncbi:MAG: hypothetical protein ACFCUN_02460 [Hyphomicrobiaceae bacterium]